MKALTFASRSPDQHETLGTTFDEDSAVFFMEQLVTVAMENKLVQLCGSVHVYKYFSEYAHNMICDFFLYLARDRIGLFWSDLSNHLARIIVKSHGHTHLLEWTVVGLLHLVSRLLGRHSSAMQVFVHS